MAAKRAPSAYFLFSDELRATTCAECQAAAGPGSKVSVAIVAKALGEKWRALSDEQRAQYKERALQRAAANPNPARPAAGRAPAGRSVRPCSDVEGRPGSSTGAAAGDGCLGQLLPGAGNGGGGAEAHGVAGCGLAAGSGGEAAEAMVAAVAKAVAQAITEGGALADAGEVAAACAPPEPGQAAAAAGTGGEAHECAAHGASAAAEAGAAAAAAPSGAGTPGNAGAAGGAGAAAHDAAMAADTAGAAAADACAAADAGAAESAGTAAAATAEVQPGAPRAVGVAAGEQEPGANPSANPFGFPLSLVKRIMELDPDVKRVSGDGLRAMAKVTELLVELLTDKAAEQARRCKRRTVRFCDIEAAVRAERRWAEIGLRDLLKEETFAEVRDGAQKPRAGKENAADACADPDPDTDPGCAEDKGGAAAGSTRAKGTGGKRPAAHKPGTPDKRARHITDFFHTG